MEVTTAKNKRRIKALLVENGISQVELAKMMSKSVVTINAKVQDVNKFKLSELYVLAHALNMSIVELIAYIEH